MDLTPVWEVKISTSSDKCEIGDDNICHFDLGQFFNLDNHKKLYVAVKEVEIPKMHKSIINFLRNIV